MQRKVYVPVVVVVVSESLVQWTVAPSRVGRIVMIVIVAAVIMVWMHDIPVESMVLAVDGLLLHMCIWQCR